MPDEIKACPFPSCKGKAFAAKSDCTDMHIVFCGICKATGPEEETPELAIQRWNEALR